MTSYFDPVTIGDLDLPNRIIMAPLTRARATRDGVPVRIMADYYRQRAGTGLIISEATYPNDQGIGFELVPGLYNDAQVEAWKPVTDAVHAAGGRMFCQLGHCGRVAASYLMNGRDPLSPSGLNDDLGQIEPHAKLENGAYVKIAPTPSRAMTLSEIQQTVEDFGQAAANAMRAGFDGVEIHAANGYLPNQFLSDRLNTRDDRYGGSIENRARFVVEIFEAMNQHVPANRIGIRVSPYGVYNNARPSDPAEIFGYLARQMDRLGAAYMHSADTNGWFGLPDQAQILNVLRPNFSGAIIANGGLTVADGARLLSEGRVQAIAFGRAFIANPDLVDRIAQGAPLAETPQGGWYAQGEKDYANFPTLTQMQTA
ncbi:alkene reductase [Thalassococcus sp. BH17M4-6]|uniref:alkene reductase n=1 Tax=Thalassococcus sp. BH17M4-6 TaxID=3413148 RepID=UPI003BD36727